MSKTITEGGVAPAAARSGALVALPRGRHLPRGIANYFILSPNRASCGMPSSQPRPTGDHDASLPAHARAAEAVRHRRLELGWTQDHLAERAGLSAATVRKVEAAAQPHYRDLTCTRLCTALGWAPDALDALRTRPSRPTPGPRELPTSTSLPPVAPAPDSPGALGAGTPDDAEITALYRRISRLDARQWERLLAFVDGLTATDR